ncbi:MAG: type II toxin-antitoxin system VapC family toxin [Bacteroidales bacterium]
MKLYVDSNVFISLIREEVFLNRTLFDEALSFFERVKERKDTIVISELIFHEILKKSFNSREDIIERLWKMKISFEEVNDEINLLKEVKESKIHYPDCIHANTAIKTNCKYLITFNLKDFISINNKINVIQPRDY